MNRRLRTVVVGQSEALSMFASRISADATHVAVRELRLPEDARIVTFYPDPLRGAFKFIVWSATFEEVPEGVEPPEMKPNPGVRRIPTAEQMKCALELCDLLERTCRGSLRLAAAVAKAKLTDGAVGDVNVDRDAREDNDREFARWLSTATPQPTPYLAMRAAWNAARGLPEDKSPAPPEPYNGNSPETE